MVCGTLPSTRSAISLMAAISPSIAFAISASTTRRSFGMLSVSTSLRAAMRCCWMMRGRRVVRLLGYWLPGWNGMTVLTLSACDTLHRDMLNFRQQRFVN